MPTIRTITPDWSRATFVALVVLHTALAAWLSQTRPVDGDEGFYAAAAQLVAQGQTPYHDFFYPQAPLVPYLYALPWRLGLDSLRLLRLVSVAMSALTIGAWGLVLRRLLPHARGAALAALAVLALHPGLLTWHVTVKTYAAADLFVTLALLAAWRTRDSARALWPLAAGAAAGLAVSTRSLYAPVALLVVAWPLLAPGRAPEQARRLREMGLTALGLAAGLLPMLALFVQGPAAFWFDNLGCHLIRNSALRTTAPSLGARLATHAAICLRAIATYPYVLLTLLGAAAGAWLWWRRRPALAPGGDALMGLSLGAFVLLLLASLLPDPSQGQYFTVPLTPLCVPALAVALLTASGRRREVGAAAAGLAVVLSAHAIVGRRTEQPREPIWALPAIERVARDIRKLSAPDDVVLAFWPGYVFESGRRYTPGLENHFGVGLNLRLTDRQRERYHIAGPTQLFDAFAHRRPKLFVMGGWMSDINQVMSNEAKQRLLDEMLRNYVLVEDYGDVGIMALRPEPGG